MLLSLIGILSGLVVTRRSDQSKPAERERDGTCATRAKRGRAILASSTTAHYSLAAMRPGQSARAASGLAQG